MLYAMCLGLFLPLIGFFGLVATSRFIERRWAGCIACTTVFLSFLCFSVLLFAYSQGKWSSETLTLFPWIHFNGIHADFTLHLDALSLLMTLMITGVGFLIHVYSNGYMDYEEDFARFFAFLNFFVFAMLLLVLAGDLLVLFMGWEGVGLASYLLIGFWYQRPAAAQAATKAFVVNRVGDLGFLLGLLLTFSLFETSNIAEVIQQAGQKFAVGAPVIMLLTLLYFIGATGKSAQIPLHIWLPDAMEGPTPVSALIHAATMVTAGVYLVVRLHPVYQLAPEALAIIGVIGAVTALYAALCALGQTDLKRVLAYSTVSQLGFMFVACGVGAFYAAMFHLTMHAFVKALLFLSAGNVVHMMHGTTEMAKMGGLSKLLPKTNWLFLIGVLALSGIPPLAAFFSKDLILEETSLTGFNILFYISLSASTLTAFYMTRAYCLTFMGAPRLENHLLKLVKEAPAIMLIPVSVLAVLSIFGGFLAVDFGRAPALERFLERVGVTLAVPTHGFLTPSTYMAVGGAILAVLLAALLYTRFVDRLGSTLAFLKKSFYIDDIYEWLFVRPLKAFSRFIADFIEPVIFDGSIRVLERATMKTAHELQKIQSGQIRSYVAWMVIGMALIFVYFVF